MYVIGSSRHAALLVAQSIAAATTTGRFQQKRHVVFTDNEVRSRASAAMKENSQSEEFENGNSHCTDRD